jgi:hypothetical protein
MCPLNVIRSCVVAATCFLIHDSHCTANSSLLLIGLLVSTHHHPVPTPSSAVTLLLVNSTVTAASERSFDRRQLKETTARCAKLEQQRSAAEVRANKAEADLDSVKSKGAATGTYDGCKGNGARSEARLEAGKRAKAGVQHEGLAVVLMRQ